MREHLSARSLASNLFKAFVNTVQAVCAIQFPGVNADAQGGGGVTVTTAMASPRRFV